MRYLKPIFLFIAMAVLASGCGSPQDSNSDDTELTIYTSVYPIQYIAERISGDLAAVETIYPPGVDAHSYEPSTRDMTKIAESDAFIYLGNQMEPFADAAAEALQSEKVSLIELGEYEELFLSLDGEHHHEDEEHHHGDFDPHIWLDPIRMIKMSEVITNHLVEISPENEELFQENFQTLKKDLTELDEEFQRTLSSQPNRNILVSHAAYGYWEERYGIKQISILGLSSSTEPSQQQLTKIIDEAKEHQLKYILYEQNTSNRISEVIEQEIGLEPLTLHNLAVLTEEDIANNEDYLSLMRKNLDTLLKATE